jgi:uncharacterized protein YbaP (TraB family)
VRTLSLFIFCAFALHAFTQSSANSLLWRITRVGTSDTSYLYGTLHSRDARAFKLQDSTLTFLDRCDLVAGELEIEGTKRMSSSLANAMFLPEGRSLDALYSNREYKLVAAALKERLGPLAPLCTKLRPFYIIAMLTEMDMNGDSATVLDAWLQSRAAKRGTEVIGLETVAEQLEAVERIALNDQARLLLKVLREEDMRSSITAALDAYAAHDLNALMALIERDGLPEHADKALLVERNVRMADRLDARMKQGRHVFGAVGAAHLPGDHGILQLLRNRGYVVMPAGQPAAH